MVMVTFSSHDAIASEPTALDLSVSSLPASFELNLHALSLGNSVEVAGNTDHATAPRLRIGTIKFRNSIVTSLRDFDCLRRHCFSTHECCHSPRGFEPVVTCRLGRSRRPLAHFNERLEGRVFPRHAGNFHCLGSPPRSNMTRAFGGHRPRFCMRFSGV